MNISSWFDIGNVVFTVPLAGYGTDSYAVSLVELWATITGLWSVIAFRKNSLWAYPIGLVNCAGFIAIFYQINLYSDLLLNVYFVAITLLGWVWWSETSCGKDKYPIRYLSRDDLILMTCCIYACTYFLGHNIDFVFNGMAQSVAWLLGETYTHTPAATPMVDAFTTVSSVVAMYLLSKRYVESWVLWVIVDIVCVGLYFYRGVVAMSAEYAVFLANAVYALYQWSKIAEESE